MQKLLALLGVKACASAWRSLGHLQLLPLLLILVTSSAFANTTQDQGLDAHSVSVGGELIPAEVSEDRVAGLRTHHRLMHWDFKYPLVQVEETVSTSPTAAAQAPTQRAKVADHLIVTFKAGISERAVHNLAAQLGMAVRRKIKGSQVYLLSFKVRDFNSLSAARQRLSSTAGIASVGEDFIVQINKTPNDTSFGQLWGMLNNGQTGGTAGADIRATQAWDISIGSKNVLVGVIDTGIDYNHPDLVDNMWVNPGESGLDANNKDKKSNGIDDDNNGYVDDWHGWDFVNNDNNPMDDHSHGTHCSGTIGGVGNNNQGVAGVCWNVSLVGLKFLSGEGSGAHSDAIEAVLYGAKLPLTLTSNSWGGGGFNQALKDAIDFAGTKNQLFVAAAGNRGSNNDSLPHYPSSYTCPNIIAVAATDHYDNLSSFSCFGATSVDLAAPGTNVYSSIPNNQYATYSGTSMATPHVAGACALLKSANRSLSASQIKQALLEHGDPIPALAGKCLSNSRLNLYQSLLAIAGPYIGLQSQSISEDGNGDGFFNPGEAANITLTMLSAGTETVSNTSGQMSSTDPNVIIETAVANYGHLSPGQSSSGTTSYKIRLLAGTATPRTVALTCTVTSDNAGPWTFPITIKFETTSSVSGYVKRSNGSVVANAVVSYSGPRSGQITTGSDGAFSFLVGDGTHTLVAKANGLLDNPPVSVTTPPDATVDLMLGLVNATVSPSSLALSVDEGQSTTVPLTIGNLGDVDMIWSSSSPTASISRPSGLWHETNFRSPDARKNWYYGQEDKRNYDTGKANSGALILTGVSIPTVGNSILSFRQWRKTESGSYWDSSLVQVSTNNGNTWTTVHQELDTSGTWIHRQIPLNSFAGQGIWLRFYFDTKDASLNNYEGWYVGDIRLHNMLLADSLSTLPPSGTIASLQSPTISVVARAGMRPAGNYLDELLILSNDPLKPKVSIPVHFEVKAAPSLIAGTALVDDDATAPSIGDGDGLPEPGETFALSMALNNIGSAPAKGVQATLSSSHNQVLVTTATSTYAMIQNGGTAQPASPWVVKILPTCPNNTDIPFVIDVLDAQGHNWKLEYTVKVRWAYNLSGLVTAQGSGAAIAGVTVSVGSLSVQTSASGEYLIAAVPAGNFTASASKSGYLTNSAALSFSSDSTWNTQLGTRSLALTPVQISATLFPGQSSSTPISLNATGTLPVTWSAKPILSGFSSKTSDQPGGPAFVWNDISVSGTKVTGLGDDSNVGPLAMGINFPFYGNSFSTVRICSNGFISFNSTSSARTGTLLPNAQAPSNLIAGLWRDMDLKTSGTVHYQKMDASTFIVQYTNVPLYGLANTLCSFQIVLGANGSIKLYYQRTDSPTSACVGVQNANGSKGLTLAFNQAFLHAGLAVQLTPVTDWLSVQPAAGSTVPGSPSTLTATFNSTGLSQGTYNTDIQVFSDDLLVPLQLVQATLTVTPGIPDLPGNYGPVVEPFSYTGTHIPGNNGGSGWAGAWTMASPKNAPYNKNTIETTPFMDYPVLVETGSHLKWWTATGTNPQALNRNFATPIADDGKAYWMAFEIQSACQKNRAALWLNGYNATSLLSLYGGSAGTMPAYYLLDDTAIGASPNRLLGPTSAGILFVFKFQMSGTVGVNDVVTAYINPDLTKDASTWTFAASRVIDLNAGFNGISLKSNNNGSTVSYANLDEFRIASTWQAAVGLPDAPVNHNPLAVSSVTPASGTAPLLVSFDGTGSSDEDGDTLSYSWNFGDGQSSNSASGTHTYAAAGTYSCQLTVSDGNGGTTSVSKNIVVTKAPALVSEAFAYAGTHIPGNNGGTGWSGAWSIFSPRNAPFNNNTLDAAPFLDYPMLVETGAHLKWWTATGTNPQALNRNFATAIADDGKTYWLAFEIQSACQKNRAGLWLNGYAATSLLSLYGGSAGLAPAYYLLDDTSTGASANRIMPSSNAAHLLVFKIQMSGSAGVNDIVTAYANPNLSTDASTWVAAASKAIDLSGGFNGISLRSNNNGSTVSFARFDEFRLATTWPAAVGL